MTQAPDEEIDGFQNMGKSLVVSDYLLEQYLEAAKQSLEKAINFDEAPPVVRDFFVADDAIMVQITLLEASNGIRKLFG